MITSLAAFGARDSIYALALQTVGGEARIVAAGGEGDFAVARYLPNGTLDATFGAAGTGKVTALMGSTIGAARAVRIAADDKIVLAGHVSHDFALVRLTRGGQVDTGFGSPPPGQGRDRRADDQLGRGAGPGHRGRRQDRRRRLGVRGQQLRRQLRRRPLPGRRRSSTRRSAARAW